MTLSFININVDTIDQITFFNGTPPIFTLDTIVATAATEDASYLNSIGEYAFDPDGDTLNYTKISGPSWLSVAPNGDLSGIPVNDDVGVNSWIIEVDDGLPGTDQTTLQITVINTNDNPVFYGDTIFKSDASIDVLYNGTLAGDVIDADGDPLYFSVITGPDWLSVGAIGILSGTPLSGDAGQNQWSVKADDNHDGVAIGTLHIVVTNPSNIVYRNLNGKVEIIVYPTPVSERLFVQINGWGGKTLLTLYNIFGKEVYVESIITEDVEIDVTSFPKGVYFLKISNENLQEGRKIIIQ